MIRYSLVCAEKHGFEAWFRDSGAFDDLDRNGLLACPTCGSSDVRKALMAPAVRRRDTAAAAVANDPPPSDAVPVVLENEAPIEDDKARQLRALLREMHDKLKSHAENVGAAFPEEARKIHEGDTPPRAIYGTASNEEVRSLIEDGVGVMPLPPLPDDRN